MHAKYEDFISYGSKVIAKVKIDNRHIDKQTNRQGKINMPPIVWCWGKKPEHKTRSESRDINENNIVQ